MTDDIVPRLRNVAPYAKAQDHASIDPYYFSLTGLVNGAADEIERLRRMAMMLIDELRQNGGYEAYTPNMLFQEFYEEAHRG